MDLIEILSGPTLRLSSPMSCGPSLTTLRENSPRSRWSSSRCGGITKTIPWRTMSSNSLKMGSLSWSMQDGLCMMRLAQPTMIWSIICSLAMNGSRKNSESSPELVGKLILSVTLMPTQGFSQKWALMPCSLQDLTTKTKRRGWMTNLLNGFGCQTSNL